VPATWAGVPLRLWEISVTSTSRSIPWPVSTLRMEILARPMPVAVMVTTPVVLSNSTFAT